jgi:hypothetical protein
MGVPSVDYFRDHPFKALTIFRWGGDKNLPNLPTDCIKKLPKGGGRRQIL